MKRQKIEMYKTMLMAKHSKYNKGEKIKEVSYLRESSDSRNAVFKVIGVTNSKEYTIKV